MLVALASFVAINPYVNRDQFTRNRRYEDEYETLYANNQLVALRERLLM
jgi:hypothetical protein